MIHAEGSSRELKGASPGERPGMPPLVPFLVVPFLRDISPSLCRPELEPRVRYPHVPEPAQKCLRQSKDTCAGGQLSIHCLVCGSNGIRRRRRRTYALMG